MKEEGLVVRDEVLILSLHGSFFGEVKTFSKR